MKHSFVSPKADGSDNTLVQASAWNGVHIVGVTSLSANTTLTSTHDFIKATGGTLGITLTLPAVATGLRFEIKKVDSGVGYVTVAGTIDGATNYILSNKNQYVVVNCDGTGWHIVGNN